MSGGGAADKRRSGVRVLGIGFLVIFLLLSGAALIAYFGWQGKPAYWKAQQERIAMLSSQERADRSEALVNTLLHQWSEGPADATTIDQLIGHRTTLEIPYEELNVWLAEEGIGLMEQVGVKMPKMVKGAMVDSPGGGLLRVSCDLDNGQMQQVVALTFDIAVADDGTVTSKLKEATAGRLPLPTETAIDLIAKRGDKQGRMVRMMKGEPVGPIDLPIDPSADGLRDGRLVGLEVRGDALVVTRESVRREKKDP